MAKYFPKPIRFRLYPEPTRSRLYVRVNVWPTLASMRAFRRAQGIPTSRHTLGSCTQYDCYSVSRRGPARKKPIFAEINLARGYMGMEVVTHEITHATIAWARRVGLPIAQLLSGDNTGRVSDVEERFAYVHGRMCGQLVLRAEARGIYPKDRGRT